jgi:hypothetical protein
MAARGARHLREALLNGANRSRMVVFAIDGL